MNEEELIRETRKLIGRWDNIRIIGQGWAGDTRRGFQFNPIRTISGGVIPVTPSGACCPITGDCFIATQVVCEGGGGTYQGDNTPCVPDPCTPDTGACCVGSDCSVETESDCIGLGGVFQGVDTTCSPNPCPQPTGACCVGIDCTIETEDDCTGMGGTYKGDDTTCDPNPCSTCECTFTDPNLPGRFFQNLRHEECRREQVSPSSIVYLAAWADFDCSGCTAHGGPNGTSLDCGGEATVDCSALDCSFFCSDGHFHGGGGRCIDEPVVTVEVIGTMVTYTSICTNAFSSTDELIIRYIFSNECTPP